MSERKKHLVLFFTHDVSLRIWKDSGLYEREVRPYLMLARDHGWRVSFVTGGDANDLKFADELAPITILPAWKTLPRWKILRLVASPFVLLRHRKPIRDADIYKTNQFWGGWNAVLASWFFGGKVLARSGYEYLAFAKAQRKPFYHIFVAWIVDWFVYMFAHKIVVATQEDALFARYTFPFLKEREIEIQPNWIDTDLFTPSQAAVPSMADLVYIGRLNAQKNLHALIAATAQADASLDIYGDGELEKELRELTEILKARVSFKGRIANDRIPAALAGYKIFMLTSHFEGNPKALLEAMACGKPVIASDVPGIRSVIKDNETGLLCGTDENAITAAIQKLLNNESLQKRLGDAAQTEIENNNSLKVFLKNEQARLEALTVPFVASKPLQEPVLVSVIMSAYNAAETLEKSVRSILDQTYKDFEFIIVNDGSTDNSLEILKRLADEDKRLVIIDQANTGLTKALNIAAARAKGTLIARQDSDDYALPQRLELQVARFLADPDLLLLGGNALDVYPDGTESEWGHTNDNDITRKARLYAPFPHASAMMRADAFHTLRGYDERWLTAQDTELWMRFAQAGKIAMLAEPVLKRGVGKNSITAKRRLRQFRDANRARLRHYNGSKFYVLYFSTRSLVIGLLPHGVMRKLKKLKKIKNP